MCEKMQAIISQNGLNLFLLVLAIAFVSSDANHTSTTNISRTSTISDSAQDIRQESRDKRLESKINDCLNSNYSTNDNVTKNCNNTQLSESSSDSDSVFFGSPKWFGSIKSGALERTGFVALGIMSIIVIFFVIRAIRLRQKRSKSRKYGVIASTASDVEMEPLERGTLDDDEEETTLFDAQHNFRLK